MFDTRTIGKQIAKLRKNNNLTQMELADQMGVSYQAVSNWERGNSMPDISKLPELANIFSCSIDNILGESKYTDLAKQMANNTTEEYLKTNKVSLTELSDIIPLVKPNETESIIMNVIQNNPDKISLKDLVSLAPFLDEELLNKVISEVDYVESVKDIVPLAPYLSDKNLDEIIDKVYVNSIDEIMHLVPYLSEESLNKITGKLTTVESLKEIIKLAPYLREEALDQLAELAFQSGNTDDCVGLYPFLSQKTMKKLADQAVKEKGVSGIMEMMPYL